MTFNEMQQALNSAEATIKVAESYMSNMANILVGRLRKVNPSILKRLKKELTNFNSQTGEWK